MVSAERLVTVDIGDAVVGAALHFPVELFCPASTPMDDQGRLKRDFDNMMIPWFHSQI